MFASFQGSIRDMRKSLDKKLSEKKKVNLYIFIIVATATIFSLVLLGIMPKQVDVKVGDIAEEEIRATKEIVDEVETEKYRLEAMESVEPRYRVDTSIQIRVKNDIRTFFETLRDAQEKLPENYDEGLESLLNQKEVSLSREDYVTLLNSTPESILTLESNIYEVINQIMNIGAKEEDIEYAKNNVEATFSSINNLEENIKKTGANTVNAKIIPNKFLDLEATNIEREKAAEEVVPVVISEGEIIVNRNEVVDQQTYDLLENSKLLRGDQSINYSLILGAILITVAIELTFGLYLYYFERNIFNDQKLKTVIFIIVILVLLITKSLSTISGYLMPVATATILISILINGRVAILINILIGVLLGITTNMEPAIMTMALIGGIIGAFSAINTQQRSNIMLIGMAIAFFNAITAFGFGMANSLDLNTLLIRSIYGVINGLLSAVLAIGSMPLWENIFGILTPIKLLELMNPNQPALKKLLLEAPGTYYHSILVGNLGESAADEVGANSLLVRVGAYYHDIGKTKRAYFFKENQIGIENLHDKISPNLSAIIITNHTKDGIEMAEKYYLPAEIKNIIVEHHGTTLVSFFYHKALNEEGVDPNDVLESRFRYSGPKPQFKESAIVMLADSIEAAARVMKEPDQDKISSMISCIVKSKLEDGQLDECGLTLRDLKKIEKSFANTLMGIYHERIEYPSLDIADIKEGK